MLKKKILFLAVVIASIGLVYSFVRLPKKTHSASFTSASATLSNSRFSYRAGITSGTTAESLVTIDGTGNADNNTNHLFPKDSICFANALQIGCLGNKSYTVANILAGGVTFNTTGVLTTTLEADGFVVATQSGSLAITFTTATEVPVGGNLFITIPAVNTTGMTADGIPDTAATAAANGFDLGTIATGDVTVSDIAGCTSAGWGSATVTAGTAGADHTIEFTRASATCAASKVVTVTIDSSPGIINPAPLTTHTQGVADPYQINIKTRDGGDNTLDSTDVSVSPVEGILISATIDETLALTIAGITADAGSFCGVTRTAASPDTTATSVSWGTLSPDYLAATHNTNHQITISTNSTGGYSLYVEENDQMGKDGVACAGNGGEAVSCIQDTVCTGAPECSEALEKDWGASPTSYPGLGYSLEDTTGTDAVFEFNDTGTFQARQFADIAATETRAAIMTNAGPVDGSAAYVCYRIDVTGTQPAGFYYNRIKYTAVPIF